MGSDVVVTVGTRHVKVWRSEPQLQEQSPSKTKSKFESVNSPAPGYKSSRILAGRNVLLGALLDSCFTSVVTLVASKAIVATDRGAICLLDTSSSAPGLSVLRIFDNAITSLAAMGPDCLWVGLSPSARERWSICRVALNGGKTSESGSDHEPVESPKELRSSDLNAGPLALCGLQRQLISLDSDRTVQIFDMGQDTLGPSSIPRARLRCHRGPVMGVCASPNGGFVTWDSSGLVLCWSWPCIALLNAHEIELESPTEPGESNELRILRVARSPKNLATPSATQGLHVHGGTKCYGLCGDKYGMLKFVSICL